MRFARPSTAARWSAIAVAALALWSQLAGFAHLVAVDHVACEHGELVHLDRGAPAVAAHHDAEQSFHPSPAGARDTHEHCLLSPLRRNRSTVAPRAPHAIAVAAASTRVSAQARFVVPAPIPLLLFAPKSSPPSA